MTMFTHSQASLFEGVSTFSPEDSPVSHSHRPESGSGSTTNAICSPKCSELSERFSPLGPFLKTLMGSSRWHSKYGTLKWDAQNIAVQRTSTITKRYTHERKLCCSTVSVKRSNAKDTPSNRLLFRLCHSKRTTKGKGSGSLREEMIATRHSLNLADRVGMLPTPKARTGADCPSERRRNTPSLDTQIALLPTPRTRGLLGGSGSKQTMQDAVDAGQISAEDATGLIGVEMIGTLLATTRKRSAKFAKGRTPNLAEVMLSTPCQTQHKGSGSNETVRDRLDYDIEKTSDGQQTGMRLQPAFVEYLMDLPLNWTSLEQETIEWTD